MRKCSISKKIFIAAAAAVCCMTLAACAGSEEPSSSVASPTPEATATPKAAATPSPNPEDGLEIIGTKSDKTTVYKVILENGTKQDITALTVKDSSMEEFPESLLGEKDVFAAGEKRVLYYDTAKVVEAAETGDQDEKLLEPQYDIQIVLKDGSVLVLHAFPFGDLEEGTIKFEEEVAYLAYTSVESKKPVETKEAELSIKETEEREEPFQAYEGEAAAEEPESPPDDTGDDYAPEPNYEPEPEPDYQPEPDYVPETPAGDAGGDSGCIGDDALFN